MNCTFYLQLFFFRHIDANESKYIKRLADVVAIKSVSAWPDNRPDVVRMIEWTKKVILLHGKQRWPERSFIMKTRPCNKQKLV